MENVMRAASKRVAIQVVARDASKLDREFARAARNSRFRSEGARIQLRFIASFFCFFGSAFAQSLAISSPTAAQTIGGLSFPLTVSLTSLPSVASVEYIVDGESQGVVWSAPWSIASWNTNNRWNGPAHTICAIARNALGVTIATAPAVTFAIANSYLEPPSYINLVSVTPSTALASTWSGVVNLVSVFNGINASNAKTITVYVDGDATGYKSLNELSTSGSTATTMNAVVNTTQYLNEGHEVCLVVKDIASGRPGVTNGGYPFGEWCQQVTFSNTSTILLKNATTNADYVCWGGGACNTFSSLTAPASGTVNVTTGDFLLVCDAYFQGGATTITDTLGNSWTAVNTGTKQANWNQYCFYSANVTGGADAFTATFAGGGAKSMALLVREYSGVATSSPIDTQITSTGTSCAAPCAVSSGTFTTSNAIDIIALYYVSNINGQVFQNGLNAALDSTTSATGGGTSQLLTATVSGGTAMIGIANGSSLTYGMTVVALKAASNTPIATPSQLTLSPKDWVISPSSGTIQLTPSIANADTTSTTVTSAMNPVYTTTNSSVCTVSSSGLVTGVAYGSCGVTITLGNGLTETIYGWVSSTNVIPCMTTTGQISATNTGCIWMASVFNSSGIALFHDVLKTSTQVGIAYQNAGWNTVEDSPAPSTGWTGVNGTCASFQSTLNTYILTLTTLYAPFKFYFHGVATSLITGVFPNQFYVGVRGLGATCSPQNWQYLAQQWVGTGILLALEGPDEVDADYSYPVPSPVINSSGPFTGITCTVSGTPLCTVAYANPQSATNQNGPGSIAIFGGTSTAGLALNSTIGTPGTSTGLYSPTGASGGFTFTGPSGASGANITSSTDPSIRIEPFAFNWQTAVPGGGGDYSHYQDFATMSSLVHAGGSIISAAPRAIAGPVSQCGWGGACSYAAGSPAFSDYAIIYNSPGSNGTAQYVALPAIRTANLNVFPQNRTFINGAGSLRAFIGQTQFIQTNWGMNGQVITGVSCSGSLCTFPSPICGAGTANSLCNVVPYVSRVIGSSSSNSYYNANFYIDNCPTATTCNISRQYPSIAGLVQGSGGTITIAGNGVTMGPTNPFPCIIVNGGSPNNTFNLRSSSVGTGGNCSGTTSVPVAVTHSAGLTFTLSGMTGSSASYYNANTFILSQFPSPYITESDTPREVPPSSQSTSSVTFTLNADDGWVRGQGQSFYGEIVQGPRVPFAFVLAQAITGATGVRAYTSGENFNVDQNFYKAFGSFPCQTGSDCLQGGATQFYDQGADLVRFFNSPTNANLLLQRLAATGYLYGTRGNAPDIGFNIESSVRQGSKGNLLLTANFQDGAQTHSVNLAACDVSGQAKIRYTVSWTTITITTLPSGTLTDAPTWPAGGAVIYLCPNNEAAEYPQPLLSVHLADVTNAASVAVQYAYSPWFLSGLPAAGIPNSVNCSTGATCVIPVDKKIGPLYYRLIFMSSPGAVVATSDIQTL
jgi:hypothetical protein